MPAEVRKRKSNCETARKCPAVERMLYGGACLRFAKTIMYLCFRKNRTTVFTALRHAVSEIHFRQIRLLVNVFVADRQTYQRQALGKRLFPRL